MKKITIMVLMLLLYSIGAYCVNTFNNPVVMHSNLTVEGFINGGKISPAGSILMYAGSATPEGWLMCWGQSISRATYGQLFTAIGTTFGSSDANSFNVPDMRGVFARGAGTSAKLARADGVSFVATLGAYSNDKMQGHLHYFGDTGQYYQVSNAFSASGVYSRFTPGNSTTNLTGVASADSTNGTPRVGEETSPASVALNYIIKY